MKRALQIILVFLFSVGAIGLGVNCIPTFAPGAAQAAPKDP
jgi:hypothetical protein